MPAQEKRIQQSCNTSLHAEEQISTHLIFENLLNCYHLNEITSYLQKVKHWVINRNYNHAEDSIEHDDLVYFFEKMQALIEAVYYIEEQRQEEERIKEDKIEEAPSLFDLLMDKVDALYNAANYLHRQNQNELCCYLLRKTVIGGYHALAITGNENLEAGSDLAGLASNCSSVFEGLTNPFKSGENLHLNLLNTITLNKCFDTSFTIENETTECLLKEVNTVRIIICRYVENKLRH